MTEQRYNFKLALSTSEVNAYFELRQTIFCCEQRLFLDSDVDEIDRYAYPIVAIDREAIGLNSVVGVVRIYESESRLWYGGRLGVHQDYRRVGRIGKGLIYKAVTTAHAWGCDRFLATVQLQNVPFFQRLHWQSLTEIAICNSPHHLMEADLNYYPPCTDLRPRYRQDACFTNLHHLISPTDKLNAFQLINLSNTVTQLSQHSAKARHSNGSSEFGTECRMPL